MMNFSYPDHRIRAETDARALKLRDAGGSFLALRFLADGSDLKSSIDWVRFAKTSPVLTASALAASEVERRVRHRSRR
jgi:hypothetical protein